MNKTNRDLWLRDVARIEILMEREGISNTFGALLEALKNIENDYAELDGDEFYESPEYKNLYHCQQVVEYVMDACDLNLELSNREARNILMERFKESIRGIESPEFLKEQA